MNNKSLVVVLLFSFCAGALVTLAATCGRGGGECPPEVVRVDTLEVRDTMIVPGPGGQYVKEVPVAVVLADTALVDSLVRVFEEQRQYFADLVDRLEDAKREKEEELKATRGELERVELLVKRNVFEDSVRTENYRHRWKIEAEGPILSYQWEMEPFCPVVAPGVKERRHRVGAGVGLQTAGGAWRQVYYGAYGYKWAQVQAAYVAGVRAAGVPWEVQVTAGLNIPLK